MQYLKRRPGLVLILAALVPSALIALNALDMPQLGRFHDDGIYWVSAKSLAEGSGYRIASLPGQPFQTKYPPLYPMLLSLVWRIDPRFPENVRLAAVLSWLWLPFAVFLGRRVFRDMGFGAGESAVLCAALVLNPFVALYGVSLMSEVAFLCLLFAALAVLKRAAEPGARPALAAVAGALAGLAYLTRSAGLPLLAAGPLYFLLRKQRVRAALFAGAMLPAAAAWTLWVRAHLNGSADLVTLYYTDYIGFHLANFGLNDLLRVIPQNLAGMVEGAGGLLVIFTEGKALTALGAAVAFATVRLAWRRGMHPYYLYAAFYILMLAPWHAGTLPRYTRLLAPLFPLFAAGALDGGLALLRRKPPELSSALGAAAGYARSAVAMAAFAMVCLSAVIGMAQVPIVMNGQRQALAANLGAFRWISRNAPPDALVLSAIDPVTFLYTGHRGSTRIISRRPLYFDAGKAPDSVAEWARARNLSYVLADSSIDSEESKRIVASPGLQLVYKEGSTSLYKVESGPRPGLQDQPEVPGDQRGVPVIDPANEPRATHPEAYAAQHDRQ